MKKLLIVITGIILLGLFILFTFFMSTLSPSVSGVVKEGISGKVLENIQVCWERSNAPFGHGFILIDNGCINTNSNGEYKIPAKYKLFGHQVDYFDIWVNKKENYYSTSGHLDTGYENKNKEYDSAHDCKGKNCEKGKGIKAYFSSKINVNLFRLNQNPENCNGVEDETRCRISLSFYNALLNQSDSFCQSINKNIYTADYRERDNCIKVIAYLKKDKNLCNSISSVNIKQNCINGIEYALFNSVYRNPCTLIIQFDYFDQVLCGQLIGQEMK